MDALKKALFHEELNRFSQKFTLSEREKEVLLLLASDCYTNEDIAKTLDISTNTVSNHLKSLLQKTNSKCRSALLASLLQEIVNNFSYARLFTKKPKILVVDDEPDLCELLEEELEELGARVHKLTQPQEVLDYLHTFQCDFMLSDIKMPGIDGIQLLSMVREKFPSFPIVYFISAHAEFDRAEILDKGAAGFFSKPFDVRKIFFEIMRDYIETPYDKGRFYRTEVEQVAKLGNADVTVSDIGFGGAFLSIGDESFWKRNNLQIGDQVELSVKLPSSLVKCVAEIAWLRKRPKADLAAGLGVRFTNLSESATIEIQEFVRTQKMRSFIPLGRSKDEEKA